MSMVSGSSSPSASCVTRRVRHDQHRAWHVLGHHGALHLLAAAHAAPSGGLRPAARPRRVDDVPRPVRWHWCGANGCDLRFGRCHRLHPHLPLRVRLREADREGLGALRRSTDQGRLAMTLHECLEAMYRGTVGTGVTAEYLLLREAVRQLTPEQVREIEALTKEGSP